jgi:hypothetical protein
MIMRKMPLWTITFGALAGLALLIGLNEYFPLVGRIFLGLVLACIFIGSVMKLRRVAHGDFSVTSREFWLPKRWRSWMLGEEGPGRQEPPNPK